MRRLLGASLLAASLAAATAGCTNNATTVTAPSQEVETTIKFDGALTPGGSDYHLLTTRQGNVTATMNGIGPDATLTLGLAVGVYSGLSCVSLTDDPTAKIGDQLSGLATATTQLCIRVYDAGTVPANSSVSYQVSVDYWQ